MQASMKNVRSNSPTRVRVFLLTYYIQHEFPYPIDFESGQSFT